MKRSTIVLFALVILGLLVAPFAAMADAPVAEPPPGAEVPPSAEPPAPPPATEGGPACYLPAFVWEDGECTVFLDGDLSASEVAAILEAASVNDPFLGTAPIELPLILRYLKVHTPNIVGIGPITSIQVGATCTAFVAAERLDDAAYYACYAILSRAAGNATDVLCPALANMITFLTGRTGTAASKKMLESALAAHDAFCIGKTV